MLANILDRFEYLRYSLMAILAFIGVKMILLPAGVHLPTAISLLVIGALLVAGVIVSLIIDDREGKQRSTTEPEELEEKTDQD